MALILSCSYVLHEMLSANLDLLYFLSLVLIFADIYKNKRLTVKALGYIYLVVLYALLQIVLNDQIEIPRLVINVAKIFLNVFLFIQIKESKIPLPVWRKMAVYSSLLHVFLLAVSLAFKTEWLWRLDETVNIYQKTRLSLLYFEPSEASFHAALLVLLLVFFALREKSGSRNLLHFALIGANLVIVVLSAGMGGMFSLSLACVVMYLFYLKENFSTVRVLGLIALIFLAVLSVLAVVNSNNSFYLRFNDIVNGNDGSVVYRFNVSFRVMKQMLMDTHYFGIGFGNLNTDTIHNAYAGFGLVDVISNSFMYAMAEGGWLMLLLLAVFFLSLILPVRPEEKILKYALLFFIVSYQIAGGYFTNPVNWIVYGIIANPYLLRHSRSPKLVPAKNVPTAGVQSTGTLELKS